MSTSKPLRHKKFAQRCRKNGDLERAAIYYHSAANGWLMQSRKLPDELPESEKDVYLASSDFGWGIKCWLASGLCFRLADKDGRATNRCQQAILYVCDLLKHEPQFQPERRKPIKGLCHEIIGDFRVVGTIDGVNRAYDQAERIYDEVSNPVQWQSEDDFHAVITVSLELAESVGYNIPNRTEIEINSLASRIDFKQDDFPIILNKVLDAGNWQSEIL